MQSFVRDRFRFFALLVALVAVLSLTPLLLAQGGVQCGDQVVSSFEECEKLVKGDDEAEAMADGDGMMMEDGDGEGMEDGDGMMMKDKTPTSGPPNGAPTTRPVLPTGSLPRRSWRPSA